MPSTDYPVRGGLEDWGYAAGWDKAHDASLAECSPRQIADSFKDLKFDHVRAAVYLVETDK